MMIMLLTKNYSMFCGIKNNLIGNPYSTEVSSMQIINRLVNTPLIENGSLYEDYSISVNAKAKIESGYCRQLIKIILAGNNTSIHAQYRE